MNNLNFKSDLRDKQRESVRIIPVRDDEFILKTIFLFNEDISEWNAETLESLRTELDNGGVAFADAGYRETLVFGDYIIGIGDSYMLPVKKELFEKFVEEVDNVIAIDANDSPVDLAINITSSIIDASNGKELQFLISLLGCTQDVIRVGESLEDGSLNKLNLF